MLQRIASRMRPTGRLEFAARLALVLMVAAVAAASTLSGPAPWERLQSVLMPMLLLAGSLWLSAPFFAVSRLVDAGETPRRAWLALIPGYNLYFLVWLLAKPGASPAPVSDGKPADRSTKTRVACIISLAMCAGAWAWALVRIFAN